MEEFKIIFDNFNQAISAGKVEEALSFRNEETRKSFEGYIKTPEDLANTMQMVQSMIPLSYTTDHLDQQESKATAYFTATFKDPQNSEKTVIQGLMINYTKENNTWKMADIIYMADPTDIKKSPDENFEPNANYDLGSNISMGGRILAVQFEKDYTLVKIKMLDEEDLVFLPSQAELEKTGLKSTDLVPYKILQVSGHKHPTNALKIWGNNAEIIAPE